MSLQTIEKIKIWQFILLFVVATASSVWFLRQNNLRMIELRDEVIRIDKETGNFQKIEPALQALGDYVINHMNTSLGHPVELPGAYNKAVEKQRQQAVESGSVNSDIYDKAIQVCEDPNVLLTVRAQCIQDYVTRNARQGSDPIELDFPDKALYSYDFVSPAWSPDLAGFSVAVALLSLASSIVLLIVRNIIPAMSKSVERDPLE